MLRNSSCIYSDVPEYTCNCWQADLPVQSVQSQTLFAAGAFGVGKCILPRGCSQQWLKSTAEVCASSPYSECFVAAKCPLLPVPAQLCVPLRGAEAAPVRRSCREPRAIIPAVATEISSRGHKSKFGDVIESQRTHFLYRKESYLTSSTLLTFLSNNV